MDGCLLLWTSRKLSSHFAQVEKFSSYFTDFERVGNGCFLDILLNLSYPCLSVKTLFVLIFLGWQFPFLREQFCVPMFWEIKFFFQNKATVWLNLVSDILFVKTKKTKIQSSFYIFSFVFIDILILILIYWHTNFPN